MNSSWKQVLALVQQQIIGAVVWSLPVIFVAQLYPILLSSVTSKLLCAAVMGLCTACLVYIVTKIRVHFLCNGVPTGESKEYFEQIARECGFDPQSIVIRYGYSNEMVAQAMFDTISVDPLLWSCVESDPEAKKIKNRLEKSIVSKMSLTQKNHLEKVREIFLLPVQSFIFKHELGHLFYCYRYKTLIAVGIISAIAIFAGIITAFTLPIAGIVAGSIGIFIGWITNLFLKCLYNFTFKSCEEDKADVFAAMYSTDVEIESAAIFFEKHQQILDTYRESLSPFTNIPSRIATGHRNGKSRAQYIRSLLSNNNKPS